MVYRSDASKFGIGGYNIVTGIAWRFELPVECRLRTSLNSLEFLGCVISIWLDIFLGAIEPESCLLSQTDSTTAMGWLRKTNFADKPDEAVQLATARKLADLVLNSESCLYSQWFSGSENSIADSLSRDFHLESSHLCDLLLSHFPEQAPFGLAILPLPPDIVSWVTCLLLKQPLTVPWSKEPTPSSFARGLASRVTSHPLGSPPTPTLIYSPNSRDLRCSVRSLTHLEKADLVMEKVVRPSSQNLSEPPWIAYHRSSSWLIDQTYHRSSSWLIDQTQGWTEMENLLYFYSDRLEVTEP